MRSKETKSAIRNNVFYPFDKKQYERNLNILIEAGFSNQLIFLKVTFKHDEENKVIKYKEMLIDSIENSLVCISFLNLVYGRYIKNKKNNSGKFVMIIAFHSILGYDKIIESSLISSIFQYEIEHLETLRKIKKLVKYISGNYNYKDLYYYGYGAKLYGSRYTIIDKLFEESKFQPNRFFRLDLLSRYSDEKSVFRYLSRHIYSVREKSPLSIINMWNVYMLMNNLRYCPEKNSIYKKIDKDKYEYFSELDYLPKNIKRIWINITYNFREHEFFPINKLISEHLQSSINIININGSASILLPMIESAFTNMYIEEKEESDSYKGFKNLDKRNKAMEDLNECNNKIDSEYKRYIDHCLTNSFSNNDLHLTKEESRRKLKMDLHLENLYYL